MLTGFGIEFALPTGLKVLVTDTFGVQGRLKWPRNCRYSWGVRVMVPISGYETGINSIDGTTHYQGSRVITNQLIQRYRWYGRISGL